MGKGGNIGYRIGVGGTIGAIVLIGIYNIIKYGQDFFKASIYQIVSLLFAIIITYLLTQKKNDARRKADMLEKMFLGIEKDITDKSLIQFVTVDERNIALLQQKSLASRLEYLKEAKICVDIASDVEYMAKEMENLREFYGAHMSDKDYMEKSTADMEKYIVNITDKCFAVRLKLYEK